MKMKITENMQKKQSELCDIVGVQSTVMHTMYAYRVPACINVDMHQHRQHHQHPSCSTKAPHRIDTRPWC